jgi:hypothetical protein
MKLEFYWQLFKKYVSIKFHEKLSSGSRIVPCEQMDGQADMTKLAVTVEISVNNSHKHN